MIPTSKDPIFPLSDVSSLPSIVRDGKLMGKRSHWVYFNRDGELTTTKEVRESLVVSNRKVAADWVTLAGSDPVEWDLPQLTWSLRRQGWKVNLKTQGLDWRDWVEGCDLVSIVFYPGFKVNFDVLRKYELELTRWQLHFHFIVDSPGGLNDARNVLSRFESLRSPTIRVSHKRLVKSSLAFYGLKSAIIQT